MLEKVLERLRAILQEPGPTPRVQMGQQTQKFRLLNTPKASKHNLIMYTKFYREEKRGTKKMLT